ncbi:MAG: glutamine synthetase [Oscillospiraceae bacterium]|nr:glutamine synthetase [Oscillospiraceae bacterium]
MKYSKQEVMQFVQEEDVKFLRLAFCDVTGKPKNVSIMPTELERAFEHGIAIDASAIEGFGDETHSDIFLHPDPDTITVLPWRPEHGKVARMFCSITYPDGRPFEHDVRTLLKEAIRHAKELGYSFYFGPEMEFYLFKLDENGNPTVQPYDHATYMDVAPEDKCENVRREICLTLEKMGIRPESSHHEEGPGQNEIDFRYSDALTAADNAITFCSVVKSVAALNGLHADFSPKPLADQPGSGQHINISIKGGDEKDTNHMLAGILGTVADMTVFLNPSKQSFHRLGFNKAPKYISWSSENRSQLIRIPAATGEYRRAELRSPDPLANPYIAYTLLIYAGLYGIQNKLELPEPANVNLFTADAETLANYKTLPLSLAEARKRAFDSSFVRDHLPLSLIEYFCNR